MNIVTTKGKNVGTILLYTLSTCIWCKKTKQFLDNEGISYSYINVDEIDPAEKEETLNQMRNWNKACSYPTIVINDSVCIIGFNEDSLRKELKI